MGLHQGFIAPNIRHEYALSSKDQQNAHRMLKEVLANETYDAVIANVWSPGLYVLLEHEGQDLTQIPIVLYDRHMHHALAENGLQGERVALLKSHDLYLNCMLEADPRSQNMQDRFDVGFPKSRIHCWPWSVAAGFFLNEPSKRKGRCPYPPSTKTCFKLFSGGDSKRDYASLFKAVEGMDVELRIASGRTFEQLPENVSALGRIFLHEFRDEVRNCDAVVIPLGAAEGMDTGAAGITVFALAFALGKPVICTDHGFTRRYIVHGENGLLVEQSDWKGLREAILRLDGSPEECARLAEKARETCFYNTDLADVFLEQVDTRTEDPIEMPRSWQPSAFEAPSFALLWSGTPGGWASQRLIRLAEELRRQGYMCMVHEVRLEGEREEKARRHVELSQALRNARANVVVLNGTTAAHAYYRSAEQSGDSLAPTIVLLDDDQLEHVDELRSWYGRYAEQAWWPSRNVQLLGSNVVGEKQYVASGVPPSSTQWLPRWRLNAATESNRRPSECERVLVGGHAGCDHRLMRSVVETLPLALRARIDFVSPAATERWEISGRDASASSIRTRCLTCFKRPVCRECRPLGSAHVRSHSLCGYVHVRQPSGHRCKRYYDACGQWRWLRR